MKLFGFLQKSSREPRLLMVSDLSMKPNINAHALRRIIYQMTTAEYASTFINSGFPEDDGVRAFTKYEAHDKLGFLSDRLFEKRGQYLYWVRNAVAVDAYFDNLDLYLDTLKQLAELEKYVRYRAPYPSVELARHDKDESEWECALLDRAWSSTLKRAGSLKTEASRKRAVDTFIQSAKVYQNRLHAAAIKKLDEMRDNASSPALNGTIEAVKAQPKVLPTFDRAKEQGLVAAYRSARTETDKHFARIALITFYYKYRETEVYRDKCIQLCEEDITCLPKLDAEERTRLTEEYNNRKSFMGIDAAHQRSFDRDYKRGFAGRIDAFDKLTMIYMNRGDFVTAVKYCDMGIAHAKAHGVSNELLEKLGSKRDRVIAKRDKALASKQK